MSRSALPPGADPTVTPAGALSGRQLEAWKAEVFHDVLGTIAHHVNNAFAVVMARAEALRLRTGDDEVEAFLDLCIERGTEVHQLVNHLQSLADSNTELLQGESLVARLPNLGELDSEEAPPGDEPGSPGHELGSRLVHEIKNALGGVLSTAELVLDELENQASPLVPPMRILLGQVGRTSCLVHLLGESRGRERRAESNHDPVVLIDEVLELIAEQITRRIQIRFDRPNFSLRCRLDAGTFQAAVLNVLINAIDAIPSRGTIDIAVTIDTEEPPQLGVEISDDGIGVPAAQIDQIFEPFFAMRPDGFGLGLCVAARFIQKLGGGIHLDSSPGNGSCVTLTIPIEPAESPRPSTAESSS